MYLIEPCSHCDNDSISTFELVEHPIQIRQSELCDSSKTSKFRFLQIDRIDLHTEKNANNMHIVNRFSFIFHGQWSKIR